MGSEGNGFPMEGGEPSGAAEKAVYKKEKISVWWDVERFDVPQWCEPYTICENIRLALRKIRCIGSIKIYAYGDFNGMDKDFKLALKNTGIVLNQVSGVEDTSDKILVDMLCWAVDNPAPANYLLISDDPKLSYALHQLRMRSYNIFLAQSQCVSAMLAAAAKSVWVWTSILVGGPPLSDYQSSQFGISVGSKETEYERSFNEPNAFRALTVLCQSQGQCSGSSSKSELPNGSSGKPSQPQMQQLMCAPHEFFVTNETGMMSMAAHYESFSANKPEIPLPNATGVTPYSLNCVSGPEYPINFRDRHTFQQRIGLEGISDFTIHSETPHLQIVKGTSPISSNDIWENPECAEPYDYVQALIGVVLLALDTLKRDKMMPNEANITDCIQYGDPIHRGTDVRKALDYAIKEGMIVKQSVGTLQLYVGKNARIWNCVDPLVGDPEKYSEEIWNRIKRYLTSAGGRSAIMASKCRYEAAITLKNLCLQDLVLGDILQLLNMVITTKKWIKAHPSGWRPINIILSL